MAIVEMVDAETGDAELVSIREASRRTGMPRSTILHRARSAKLLGVMVRRGTPGSPSGVRFPWGALRRVCGAVVHSGSDHHPPTEESLDRFMVVWGRFCRRETWPHSHREVGDQVSRQFAQETPDKSAKSLVPQGGE